MRLVEHGFVAYLLYDAVCGPCTRFKNIIVRLDIIHKLMPIPLESNLAFELVRSEETREEMMQAFHIVYNARSLIAASEQQDRIFRGGDALIQLIRLLPLGSQPIGLSSTLLLLGNSFSGLILVWLSFEPFQYHAEYDTTQFRRLQRTSESREAGKVSETGCGLKRIVIHRFFRMCGINGTHTHED